MIIFTQLAVNTEGNVHLREKCTENSGIYMLIKPCQKPPGITKTFLFFQSFSENHDARASR